MHLVLSVNNSGWNYLCVVPFPKIGKIISSLALGRMALGRMHCSVPRDQSSLSCMEHKPTSFIGDA